MGAVDRLVLIEHPGHDLGVGVDVGRGHVLVQADEAGHSAHVAAAEPLQLAGRQITRVADCLLYTSPSPRDRTRSRMPSSA